MTVRSIRMPVGFGKWAIKSKGRTLSVLARLKTSVVEVKEIENCLAHALIIEIAKADNNPEYVAYRRCYKIRPIVQDLLATTGIDLTRCGGIPELIKFQEHFRDYKINVYQGLACEDIMFEGQVDLPKIINLLYDDVERHYHMIVNITGAMSKRLMCKACNKSCARDATNRCDQTCSDCMARPSCAFSAVRIPCAECNRHFRTQTCFANHKQST